MSTRGVVQTVAAIIVVALCSATVSAGTYRLTVAGERLEFVAQVERGYVVKLTPDVGGIRALAGMSALDAEDAAPIGGLDRRGVWVVENRSSAERNEETIRSLQAGGRVGYAAPLFCSNGETVAIIPEIVVRVKPGIEMEGVERLGKAAGCTIRKRMEFTQQEYLLEVLGPDAASVFAAVEELGQAPEVEWACPNTAMRPKLPTPVPPADGQDLPAASAAAGTVRIASAGEEAGRTGVFPNDEYFPNQWHLYNTGQSGGTPGADIRAPEAWEITTGDPNIVIAVLDTGVDLNHPDLIENLVPGYDFYDDDDMPDPAQLDRMDAHGTLCAGVAAAKGNNGIGVAGIAWNCRIMPIRICSAAGTPDFVTASTVAAAIRWAAAHGADVLSNSWVWGNSAAIVSAVKDVTCLGGIGREGKGCIVCFAVGIGGVPIRPGWTEGWPDVISIGATDHQDVRWHYSGYGPELDLVAPSGCDGEWCGGVFATLWTTDLTGPVGNSVFNDDPDLLDYAQYCGGTSFSTPMVAGVAALVLSVNPDLTNLDVGRILLCSAQDLGEPGWDAYYGFGRVDAYAAVCMAFDPPSAELFVDDDAPNDPGPGDPMVSDPHEDGSVEHPFDAIQKAIDASRLPGQIVTVLSGTYTGRGNRDINYGHRIITVRSSVGPESCIIDCESAGRAFFFQGLEGGANSAVQGLTITRGRDDVGGAIYCSSGSSPTITGCVFLDNVACIDGGAIHCGGRMDSQGVAFASKPVFRDCTFIRNSAGQNGGAIYCAAISKPIVHDCVFRENSAGNKGGGTYTCEDSGMILKGSRFEQNAASLSGGAMSNVGGDCTVTSCLFAHNTASAGAGLCCDRGRCFLTSCTVADNTSAFVVGGIWVMSGTVTVKNSIFWGNTPSQIIGPVDVSFSVTVHGLRQKEFCEAGIFGWREAG